MTRSRLFRRLDRGEAALGTIALAGSPPWVEITGNVGLDFVCIDQMITEHGWGETAHMIRAAERFGLTPWVRVQAYPWLSEPVCARTVADVMRALSIGAELVSVSVNTAEDVRRILHPASDWHQRVYLGGGHEPAGDGRLGPPLVFPQLESADAAANLDEIVAVPGLRAVFLGMGDLSRSLGHPGDYAHPRVRGFVVRAIEAAHAHGQIVIVNTGYQVRPEEIAAAVAELRELGVDVVWVPYFTHVVDRIYRRAVELVRAAEPGGVDPAAGGRVDAGAGGRVDAAADPGDGR